LLSGAIFLSAVRFPSALLKSTATTEAMMLRLTTLAIIGVWASLSQAAPVTFTAAGANSAAIQGTVDAFRTALGTLNANVVGSFGSGRREINWDGVPDALAAPNNLPANFFNVNSPRGVVFSTPGTGFQVSATAASGTPVEFGNINATYSGLFTTFSAQRLFTALGSNIVDINFFVPGTNTPAFTTGFGSVFSDVDIANATTIQFFNLANASLGTFSAPIGSGNETLSFLGVLFNAGEQVSHVRIISGNSALGPNESLPTTDLVVMDDFIYAEPRAITEPASFGLILLGLLLITGFTQSSAQRVSLRRAVRPRH
jgi:hypothetical protein